MLNLLSLALLWHRFHIDAQEGPDGRRNHRRRRSQYERLRSNVTGFAHGEAHFPSRDIKHLLISDRLGDSDVRQLAQGQ